MLFIAFAAVTGILTGVAIVIASGISMKHVFAMFGVVIVIEIVLALVTLNQGAEILKLRSQILIAFALPTMICGLITAIKLAVESRRRIL